MAIELKTEEDKTSYALGMNLGMSLKQVPKQINSEVAAAGMKAMLDGNEFLISQEEYVSLMQAFQKEMQAAQQQAAQNITTKNVEAQKEFLEKNRDAADVNVTDSGLQYKVLTEGDGAKPTPKDTVKVHYTGKLLDGTVFDSSVQRGEPAQFGVSQVIKGWTEGLQLMNVGSKYQFFIPAELAYGERGAGQVIGPMAMLDFEVELLDIC